PWSCGCSVFFFSSRRRHTRSKRDWSSDVCSSDLDRLLANMRSISETYRRNIDVMDEVLTRMPPGLRAVADATGNGPWTDVATPRSEERRVGREGRGRGGTDR